MANDKELSEKDIKRWQDAYYDLIKDFSFFNFKIDVLKKAKKGNSDGFDALWKITAKNLKFLQFIGEKKINLRADLFAPIRAARDGVNVLLGNALVEKDHPLAILDFDVLIAVFKTLLAPGTKNPFGGKPYTSEAKGFLKDPRIIKKHNSIIKSIERLKAFVKSLPAPSAPQPAASTGSAPDLTLPLIKKYWSDFWRQFFRCCRYRVILGVLCAQPSTSVVFINSPEKINIDNEVGKTGKHLNLRPFGPSEYVSKEMNSAYTSVAKQVFYVQGETKKLLDKFVDTDTKANLSAVGTFDKFLSEFVTAFIKKLGHEEKPDLKKYYKRNFVNVIVKQTTNLKTLAGQYKAQAVKNANSYIAKATARGNKVRSLMKDFYKVLLKSPRDDTAEKKFTYEPPTAGTFGTYLTGLNPDFKKSDDQSVATHCLYWSYWDSAADVDPDRAAAYDNYRPVLFSPEKFNQLCSEIKTETKKLKAKLPSLQRKFKNLIKPKQKQK